MPIYRDEPKRPSATRKGTADKVKVHKKKKTKSKHVVLSDLSVQEQGERIGYIDKLGVVRLKANGNEVGRVGDLPAESALGHFIELYNDHLQNLDAMDQKGSELKPEDMLAIEVLRNDIQTQPGLGDASKLKDLMVSIEAQYKSNASKLRADKVKLLQEIDRLPVALASGEIHWTGADQELDAICQRWKETIGLDEKTQGGLDHRLEATLRAFKDRKWKFYNDFEGNKALKEQVIRQAENLSRVDDVADAKASFERLDRNWRSIGAVEDSTEIVLRERLEQAKKDFIIENADRLSEQEERRGHLMTQKAQMVLDVESLIMSDDPRTLANGVATHKANLFQIEKLLGQDEQTLDLSNKLTALADKAKDMQAKRSSERQTETAEAQAVMDRFAVLAKANDNGLTWKAAEKELSELQNKAKSFSHISRDLRAALKAKATEAGKDLIANRTAHSEQMDGEREINAARKRTLINDLPFYKNGATSAELVTHLNTSMEAWKKVGQADREVNDSLWEEYRQARDVVFDKVKELRELERDDFKDRLSGAFLRKREALSKLEAEVSHEEFLIDNMSDEKKAAKMKTALVKQKKRVKDLQTDILDIQRKLAKMSSAKKQTVAKVEVANDKEGNKEQDVAESEPIADTSNAQEPTEAV
ncbi:MAG: DUF349 domain-containing protein [Alphaproteobacteria bacterium]